MSISPPLVENKTTALHTASKTMSTDTEASGSAMHGRESGLGGITWLSLLTSQQMFVCSKTAADDAPSRLIGFSGHNNVRLSY